MSPFKIVKQEDNDNQDGSLVLAIFGPFVVVDASKYNNEKSELWHHERAIEYQNWLASKGGSLLEEKE